MFLRCRDGWNLGKNLYDVLAATPYAKGCGVM